MESENLTFKSYVFPLLGNNGQVMYLFKAHVLPVAVVQSVSQSCLTFCHPPWTAACRAHLLHYPLEFAQIHVHWVGNAIQRSHPLWLPSPLPSVFPSIKVFSNKSALLIRWPKYWSFNFNINSSKEYSGLISFKSN